MVMESHRGMVVVRYMEVIKFKFDYVIGLSNVEGWLLS